ncbi:MAG: PadR family transcriptional regulator [Rikenellaceae bacterium]|jgi:DNA-binding PadR family transcriptional regulator|nr:PadR family transcriptional regulator [Rikenellaceae bacterium]
MLSPEILKGTIKPLILKLISEEGRMYGYQITRRVELLTAGELVLTEGALYPALHKLVKEGLLKVETGRTANRERKYYSLSDDGRRVTVEKLRETRDTILTLARLFDLQPAPYGA